MFIGEATNFGTYSMTTRNPEATAILKIHGMSKAGRAGQLRRAIARLEGVILVDINYTLDNMTITYYSDKTTLTEVRRMLNTKVVARRSSPHVRSLKKTRER